MKSLLTSIFLILALQAEATITRVRSTYANTSNINATTLVLDFNHATQSTNGGTPAAGDTLVIAIAGHLSSGVILRMSDQTGITWQSYQLTNNPATAIIVGRVFSSIASSQVTVNSGVAGTLAVIGAEYSGTNIRVDKQKSFNGGSVSPSTGTTETTSNANELWVGMVAAKGTNANAMSAATNGFSFVTCAGNNYTNTTNGTSNLDVTCGYLEKIVTSTGAATTGCTITNNTWNSAILTFEETPTGTGQRSWIGWIQFFNWLKSGGLIKK